MASQSADIGSELLSLTAELPTLATAMKSAPPTGEGAGEWECGAKERGCTKSNCTMLFVVLWDAYTLLNNKYLTRWFRGVGHTGRSKHLWHFWLFGLISFQIIHLWGNEYSLTHLLGQMLTVLTENVLKLCQEHVVFLFKLSVLFPTAGTCSYKPRFHYQEGHSQYTYCVIIWILWLLLDGVILLLNIQICMYSVYMMNICLWIELIKIYKKKKLKW